MVFEDGNQAQAESTDALLGHLDAVADYLQASASNRLSILKSVLPIGLIVAVGGTVAMVYCLTLFLPLVWMINDLSVPVQILR